MDSDMEAQMYSLRWKNYQSHIMAVFDKVLSSESFADVTLVCGDAEADAASTIKAHKIILGACSPYFELVLSEHPCQHPVVILPPEVRPEHLHHVLNFVYRGEVQVPQEQLEGVLRCAGQLRIRGLDSDYGRHQHNDLLEDLSRESSAEPERPVSQQSGAGKRKSSPRYHFLKNRRRAGQPVLTEETTPDGSVQDDQQSLNGQGQDAEPEPDQVEKWEQASTTEQEEEEEEEPCEGGEGEGQEEGESPVDFTIKAEEQQQQHQQLAVVGPSPAEEANEMAAFLASAVRSAAQFQEGELQAPATPLRPMVPFPSFGSNKTYTKKDMSQALDALRSQQMSLSRASEMYGIPPTTLWQRANRMGIPTPKKDTANKNWSEDDLQSALEALRKKEISANKAAKVYKIPSSTLYKIARKEGIELAQPFNAVATTWSQDDLNNALEAIKAGMPVQKAAAEHGIPSGTLYGRCKKIGIELTKTSQAHWSEDDMISALDAVRTGALSINQAAIHYHLPYSSLYGRINRLKREQTAEWAAFRDYDMQEMEEDMSNGIDFSHYLSTSHDTGDVGGDQHQQQQQQHHHHPQQQQGGPALSDGPGHGGLNQYLGGAADNPV